MNNISIYSTGYIQTKARESGELSGDQCIFIYVMVNNNYQNNGRVIFLLELVFLQFGEIA